MSRRLITIKADDGRLFSGNDYEALENEVNAYEADLILQKQKEEAEKKAKEEKEKKLAQHRSTKLKEINELLQKSKDKIDEYEKETGNKLIYSVNYCDGKISVKEVRNTLDMAWDNVIDEVFKAMHSKDICRLR